MSKVSVQERNKWCIKQCDGTDMTCIPGKPNAVGDGIQCNINGEIKWVSAMSGRKSARKSHKAHKARKSARKSHKAHKAHKARKSARKSHKAHKSARKW